MLTRHCKNYWPHHQHAAICYLVMREAEKDPPNNCQPLKLLFCTLNFGEMKAMTCLWSLFKIAFDWLEPQIKRKVRERRRSSVWRISESQDATQWSLHRSPFTSGLRMRYIRGWLFDLLPFDGADIEQRQDEGHFLYWIASKSFKRHLTLKKNNIYKLYDINLYKI